MCSQVLCARQVCLEGRIDEVDAYGGVRRAYRWGGALTFSVFKHERVGAVALGHGDAATSWLRLTSEGSQRPEGAPVGGSQVDTNDGSLRPEAAGRKRGQRRGDRTR